MPPHSLVPGGFSDGFVASKGDAPKTPPLTSCIPPTMIGRSFWSAFFRIHVRVGGKSPATPTTSVRKPGVSSKMPATRMITPSSSSSPGRLPVASFWFNRFHVEKPSCLMKKLPASAVSTTSATVGQKPITPPIWTSSVSSTMGTTRMRRKSRANMTAPTWVLHRRRIRLTI